MLSRTGATDRILSAASGLAVFSSAALVPLLSAPWYRGPAGFDGTPGQELEAWMAFSSVDVAVAATAIGSAIVAFIAFSERTPTGFAVALVLALVAAGLVLYRLLDLPDGPPGVEIAPRFEVAFDLERMWGVWASFAAAGLAVAGNTVAMRRLRRRGIDQ